MNGWTTAVFICYFIVALHLFRRDDLLTVSLSLSRLLSLHHSKISFLQIQLICSFVSGKVGGLWNGKTRKRTLKVIIVDTCHPIASNCGPNYFIKELAPCSGSISNFTISPCSRLNATSSGVLPDQSFTFALAPCSISKRAISTAP